MLAETIADNVVKKLDLAARFQAWAVGIAGYEMEMLFSLSVRWFVLASVVLFFFCLYFPAYCAGGGCAGGWPLLIFGALGLIASSPTTSGSPIILLLAWIAGAFGTRLPTFVLGLCALSVAGSFLVTRQVMDNEGGMANTVTSFGLGYWLWIASIVACCLAVFAKPAASRVPEHVAEGDASNSSSRGAITHSRQDLPASLLAITPITRNVTRILGYIASSRDGFYLAALAPKLDWLTQYVREYRLRRGRPRFIASACPRLVSAMGRRTYEWVLQNAGEWPYADRHTLVVTSRPLAEQRENVEAWTQGVDALVEHARGLDDGDVWMVGGGSLQMAFLERCRAGGTGGVDCPAAPWPWSATIIPPTGFAAFINAPVGG